MDTVKIKDYISQKAILSEEEIQERMQVMKDINKQSSETGKQLDDEQMKEVIISSANSMNEMYVLGQDNAIIGTGFAQLVLEGKIGKELRQLVVTAIQRQLSPVLINHYDEKYARKRTQQLKRMLEVIQSAETDAKG